MVLDRQMYLTEAKRLLSDEFTYRKNPTKDYQEEFKLMINEAHTQGVLTKAEKQFLIIPYPCTPYFYLKPKIHKDQQNPPGRPIITGITYNLSNYIDHFLQPIVWQLPSFIRDSSHVLEILAKYRWQSNYSWASLDVASLYTNIDHTHGLEAAQHFLGTAGELNSTHHHQFYF